MLRRSGTWWQDSEGNNHLAVMEGTVAPCPLPETGPGSKFPKVLERRGPGGKANARGIDVSQGWIRTAHGSFFDFDAFTVEGFINIGEVQTEGAVLKVRDAAKQQFALVLTPTGVLRAYVYDPAGDHVGGSTLDSGWALEAGKDYYFAVAVSTGEEPSERFVKFYLKNLTDNEPLQSKTSNLLDNFTSTYKSPTLQLRIGESNDVRLMDEVRYSEGVVPERQLMIANAKSSGS